jgi:glycerate-2-kinase
MPYVANAVQLTSHGERELRALAIDIVEHALAAADPYAAVRRQVHREGHSLVVSGQAIPLPEKGRVLFVGAGKASYPIAKAIEAILGEYLAAGIVICKHGQHGHLDRIRMVHAAHPIPDRAGADATRSIIELLRTTGPDDLVIAGITGGSSALMGLPSEPITLADYAALTKLLLECGANIVEINAVRKHVAAVGGGKLAQLMHRHSTLVNLTVSDVIGDPLDYITDPTVPDTSTLADARHTLDRYELWGAVPQSMKMFFAPSGPAQETPKHFSRTRQRDVLLLRAATACEAAARRGGELGLHSLILSTRFEGESRELGYTFGAIALEVARAQRPIAAPALLIGGGETTVHLNGAVAGIGGPNQEFAAAAALGLGGTPKALVLGIDTDGTDGPTDTAGAMIDGSTMAYARARGVDLRQELERHNVTPALLQLEEAILTGATGTNVNDLKFALIA